METVISIEGLCKDYRTGFWRRPVRVLRGLTLEVRAGEVFGYLGPNGAGKTTTLKLLLGLIYPTAGQATLLGRPIGEVSVKVDFDGTVVSGKGSSTDVIEASARAYLNALNRMVHTNTQRMKEVGP